MFKSRSRRKVAVQKANRQELVRALGEEWKDLCDAEGLDVVLGVMGRFEDDAEVQERCFCAMSSVMKAKESAYLSHERDLRRMAEAFARYAGKSEGVLKHGLLVLVLELLRTGGRAKGIIFECLGGLPLIVTALSLRGDADVVSRCCFIIGLFCDDDGPAGSACREELGRTDAVRHIVEQLGAHQDNQVVARFGAFALGHVSLNSPENVARIVSAGGVEALVRAMKQFRGCADLQEFCCYALGNIGHNNVRNQERIAMADGIDAIVAANTRFIAQPKIALNSCIALANLAFTEGESVRGTPRGSPDERSLAAAIQEMLRKKDAIAAVVSTMRVYRTNRTVQRACCCALTNIARGCPANQAAVAEAAGIEVLLGVLTRISDSAPVQRWGLLALGTIVEGSPELAARAGEHGGIAVSMRGAEAASTPDSALYKGTRSDGGDPDHALLQKVCVAALYALACLVGSEEERCRGARGHCPENECRAADAKCLETAVLACMTAYPKSADVYRHSLGIAAHVLGTAGRPATEAMRGVMESGSAVTLVVSAVRRFMGSDPEVVSLACLVLGRLAHMGRECSEHVVRCGGPMAVAAALEVYDADPGVQRAGLFALGVLCAQVSVAGNAAAEKELRVEKGVREGAPLSEAWLMDQTRVGSRGGNRSYTPECIFVRSAHAQLTVLVAGGIDLAVQALKGFPDDAGVQSAAVYALARAAEGNAEAKRQAASLGAIELAVAAMSRSPTNPALLFGGCTFLAVMALNGRAQRRAAACGGIAVIIATLLTHMDEVRIAVVALLALGLMAANNAENQAMIRTAGGIENVVAALKRHSGNEKAAENACFALALVTLGDAESAAEASARGGVPAVMAALREHSAVNLYALKWGLTALANMSTGNPGLLTAHDNNGSDESSPLLFALAKLEMHIPESEELTLCALRVVAAAATAGGGSAEAQTILCNKSRIDLVLNAVSKYPDSPRIVENGFRALGYLCSKGRDNGAQDLVREAGGIDLAVSALKSANADEEGGSSSSGLMAAMVEGVLYAIAEGTRESPESQSLLLAAGGIEAIGEALERHGGRAAGVAEWACRAFESAVRGSAEATARFADKGCVQLVVTHALTPYAAEGGALAVQRAAYGVLLAVAADASCKSILGSFDGVAKISRALSASAASAQDEAALGEGLAVLAAVAARSPVNQKALGSCVEAVVGALGRVRSARAQEAGLLALSQALHTGSTSECRVRAYRCGAVAAVFRAMKGLSSSSSSSPSSSCSGYRAGAKALVRLTTVRAAHAEVLHPKERPAFIVERLVVTCGGADPEEQDALLGVLANLACTMRPLPTLPAGAAVEGLLSSLAVVKKPSTVQRCLTALGGLVIADPVCAATFRANAGVEILTKKVLGKRHEDESAKKILESAAFVLAVVLGAENEEGSYPGAVELISSLAAVSHPLLEPCAAAISRRGVSGRSGGGGCPASGAPCARSDCPFAGKPQRYCGACCVAEWVYYCETCNRAPDSGSGGAVILCESCWKRHNQKHAFRKMFIPWKCTL